MQVFVACLIDGNMVEGFCELEEYKQEREIKKGSFSRDGKLPMVTRFRLLLEDKIFNLKLSEHYHFEIIGDKLPRYMPVTDFINIDTTNVFCKMLPAQLVWIIELR